MTIETFEIPSFHPSQLDDLHRRLENVIYPHELVLKDNPWAYGTPRQALEPLVQKWRYSYDWETARTEMNQWHHYKLTGENGLKLHFIHEPSKDPKAIPIVLVHGWPSSFYEFHKVINPLRDGKDGSQAYHVVVPSLPGYGFSEPSTTPGFGIPQMGDAIHHLMLSLGYTKYACHGTDWGMMIVRYLAATHDKHCLAMHSTMFMALPPLPTITNLWKRPINVFKFLAGATILGFDQVYGPGKFKSAGNNFADVINNKDAGYRAIQGTRPYSLSYGLTDSPVGLLGWVLEKYHNWTYHSNNKDASVLPDTISPDELLTQVSLYWLTNTISSSMRLYYEFFQQTDEMLKVFERRISIPFGVSNFESDITRSPREWVEACGNLQFYSEHSVGGHFSSLEVPDLIVDDLRSFGKKVAKSFE
ncbi:Alpha/Beta hydrolase protein [Halteromyces radiatus]|uniref:Alpha/Beta hydrolase protein n=1 Tax=Halteromyces radiatus TaxID=101107 RepID=UPI00221F7DCA|nr:Alpha/Beta hydrolase protein [Halteromyces radiatus]KAI8081300.1 Alpha/Beta hydrolase protein [Halteromyces radiatus]